MISTGNTVTTAIFDDWDTISNNKAERNKVYLEYTDDPLAYVCSLLRRGKDLSHIFDMLLAIGNPLAEYSSDQNVVEAQDREMAAKIYQHFRNKFLMRRMKNLHISNFMQAVDDIIENKHKIEKGNLSPLVKMHDFYHEDKANEAVFKDHVSLPQAPLHYTSLNTQIEYVDTVEHRTKRNKSDIQYWRTPDRTLVRVELSVSEMAKSAWEFLAEQGKIHIETDRARTHRVRGHDYVLYDLGNLYKISAV